MGLFQVVNVSVKKGTVLSTFKRTTPFVIAFSWTHLCAQVETKQKQSSASWFPGSHPSVLILQPERYSALSEPAQMWFYSGAAVKSHLVLAACASPLLFALRSSKE